MGEKKRRAAAPSPAPSPGLPQSEGRRVARAFEALAAGDRTRAAAEFDAVRVERGRVAPFRPINRMVARGPNLATGQVANVNEGSTSIPSSICSPTSDIEIAPATVTSARIRNHRRKVAVAENVRSGNQRIFGVDANDRQIA